MRSENVCALWKVTTGFVVLSAALLSPRCTHAQTTYIVHEGATPLSATISAEARYVRAQGQFLESAAAARKVNAEAVAIEIDNSVAYVKAYWKRKSVWEEEYRKRHPTVVQLEKQVQENLRHCMREQYQRFLKSDVTDQLNWLLRGMSGPAWPPSISRANSCPILGSMRC